MFTTVTELRCRPGRDAEVREFSRSLSKLIRDEPGCLGHWLYQDDADDLRLVFITHWASRQAWQAHIDSPWQRELAERSASEVGQAMVAGWSSQHLDELDP